MATVTLNPSPPAAAPKKEFINYIHNFRGLAIIFVVAGHLLMKWEDGSVAHRTFRVIWENGTVLFIFIAGFLFQFLSKKFEYSSYLRKKVEYVLLPYVLVSIPIIAYRLLTNDIPGYITNTHPDFLDWSTGSRLAYFVFTGAHMQQLWFIPMITLYYLAAPLFLYIDRNPVRYYILIPLIVLSCFIKREPFNDIPMMSLHFLSVYVFGMFMSRYRQRFLAIAEKYKVLIIGITVVVLSANLYFYPDHNNQLNFLHKMLFCAAFIYLLWKFDRFIPKFLAVLAEMSFGIFFLHYYTLLVLKAVYEKFAGHPIPGNLLNWSIYLVAVLLITAGIIKLTKKIFPKISRQLIGC